MQPIKREITNAISRKQITKQKRQTKCIYLTYAASKGGGIDLKEKHLCEEKVMRTLIDIEPYTVTFKWASRY